MRLLSPAARGHLIQLATNWDSKAFEKHAAEIGKTLFSVVANEKETDEQRIASARQLLELRHNDTDVIGQLLEQITPRTPPKLATGIIEASAINLLTDVGTCADTVDLFNTTLTRYRH